MRREIEMRIDTDAEDPEFDSYIEEEIDPDPIPISEQFLT